MTTFDMIVVLILVTLSLVVICNASFTQGSHNVSPLFFQES